MLETNIKSYYIICHSNNNDVHNNYNNCFKIYLLATAGSCLFSSLSTWDDSWMKSPGSPQPRICVVLKGSPWSAFMTWTRTSFFEKQQFGALRAFLRCGHVFGNCTKTCLKKTRPKVALWRKIDDDLSNTCMFAEIFYSRKALKDKYRAKLNTVIVLWPREPA